MNNSSSNFEILKIIQKFKEFYWTWPIYTWNVSNEKKVDYQTKRIWRTLNSELHIRLFRRTLDALYSRPSSRVLWVTPRHACLRSSARAFNCGGKGVDVASSTIAADAACALYHGEVSKARSVRNHASETNAYAVVGPPCSRSAVW